MTNMEHKVNLRKTYMETANDYSALFFTDNMSNAKYTEWLESMLYVKDKVVEVLKKKTRHLRFNG